MSSTTNYEYIKFIEPHLAMKICDFILKKDPSNENIKKYYLDLLKKVEDYEKLKENNIYTDEEINKLKEKNSKIKKELEDKLKGFLNLCENCKKNNNYNLNSFALGKKIIDETSPSLILEYAMRLFNNKEYEQALSLVYDFGMLSEVNKKNISKGIFSFYLSYSINILLNSNSNSIDNNFIQILTCLEKYKNYLEDNFKKINFDAVEKINVNFKDILLYRGYIIHWALFLINTNNIELFLDTLFDDKYFNLIDGIFNYMIKYLIIFSIIIKSKKYLNKLKEFIKKKLDKNYKDSFIDLFREIFINYNSNNSLKLLESIQKDMNYDYFMCNYTQQLVNKTKEILLENYIIINEFISFDDIKDLIIDDNNKNNIKDYMQKIIKNIYPMSNIQFDEKNNSISYDNLENDTDIYYQNQVEDLYELTNNMVNFIKKNN